MATTATRQKADIRNFLNGKTDFTSVRVERKTVQVPVSISHPFRVEVDLTNRHAESALSDLQYMCWGYGKSTMTNDREKTSEAIALSKMLLRSRMQGNISRERQRVAREKLGAFTGTPILDGKPYVIETLYDEEVMFGPNVPFLPWERFLATVTPELYVAAKNSTKRCAMNMVASSTTEIVKAEAESVQAVAELVEACQVKIDAKSTVSDKEYCKLVKLAISRKVKGCTLDPKVGSQLNACGIQPEAVAKVMSCGYSVLGVSTKKDDTCILLSNLRATFVACTSSIPNASSVRDECNNLLSNLSKE